MKKMQLFFLLFLISFINTFPQEIPSKFKIPMKIINSSIPLAYIGYEDGTNYQYSLIDISSQYSWANTSIERRPLYHDRLVHYMEGNNYRLTGELSRDRIELKNKTTLLSLQNYHFFLATKIDGIPPDYPVINFDSFKSPYVLEFGKNGEKGSIALNTDYSSFRNNGLPQYFQKIHMFQNKEKYWKLSTKLTGLFIGNLVWNSKDNNEYETVYNEKEKINQKIFSIKNKYKNIKMNSEISFETVVNEIYLEKNVYDWIVNNMINKEKCRFEEADIFCKRSVLFGSNNLNFIFYNNVTLYIRNEKLFYCPKGLDNYCRFLIRPNNKQNSNILGLSFLRNYDIYIDKENKEYAFRGFQFKSNIDLDIKAPPKKETNNENKESKTEYNKEKYKGKIKEDNEKGKIKRNDVVDNSNLKKNENLYNAIKSFAGIGLIFAFAFLIFWIIDLLNKKKSKDVKDKENDGEELVEKEEKV